MKSLKNEYVYHKNFGKGVITDNNFSKIRIQFTGSKEPKIFLYPDAFEKFLVLEDDVLQQECYEQAILIRQEQEKEEEAKRMERKRLEEIKRKELRKEKLANAKRKKADTGRKIGKKA